MFRIKRDDDLKVSMTARDLPTAKIIADELALISGVDVKVTDLETDRELYTASADSS